MKPPALEQELGLATYATDTPGIGGVLRSEPEDFRVIELGDGPKQADGKFAAAFIRLRNWETNRFVGQAARVLGLRRNQIGFAGLKDKRAVTDQWFTFQCHPSRLGDLHSLQDVHVLGAHATTAKTYQGAHEGNRFVLRIRDHSGTPEIVDACIGQIRAAGGVPHYFGPQRFGSGVRPITRHMGAALVAGDLEEAVRLYCGHPMPGEREDTAAARTVYEETRDPQAALELLPAQLDYERAILERLVKEPGNWRWALQALPYNLRTLFIHAHQSWAFNHILSDRLAAGYGLNEAHMGDRVMGAAEDGTKTHLVHAGNQARVQQELDLGRAVLTAPLPGLDVEPAGGDIAELEAATLARLGVDAADFRCYQMPDLASQGRRRGILQSVGDLDIQWQDGDPVVSFSLGRGSYATVVVRELMKADVGAY